MSIEEKMNKKYDVDAEDNIPQIVYGPPEFFKNKKREEEKLKYDVEPEDNVPREVYGIPNPSKYDVEPEKNIPQKVYGVPFVNNSFNKTAKITVSSKGKRFIISIICNNGVANVSFLDADKLATTNMEDATFNIPVEEFDRIFNSIVSVTNDWDKKYIGNETIQWDVELDISRWNKSFVGNGAYPENWNEFIDVVSECEMIYKKFKRDRELQKKAELKELYKGKDRVLKLVHTPFHGTYGVMMYGREKEDNSVVTYYKPEIGKVFHMDKIDVTVEDMNDDSISLFVPHKDGIIGLYDNYKLKKDNHIKLDIDESFSFNLDVLDAMETWEISYVCDDGAKVE